MLSGRGPQSEKRPENSNDDESNKEDRNIQIPSETNLLVSTQKATSRIETKNVDNNRVLIMHPSYIGAPPKDMRTAEEMRLQDALEESEKRAVGKKAPQEESRYVLKEQTATLKQKDPREWARRFIRMNGKSHVIGEKGYEMIDKLLEEAHQILAEEESEVEESEDVNPPMSPQKEDSKARSGVWTNRNASALIETKKGMKRPSPSQSFSGQKMSKKAILTKQFQKMIKEVEDASEEEEEEEEEAIKTKEAEPEVSPTQARASKRATKKPDDPNPMFDRRHHKPFFTSYRPSPDLSKKGGKSLYTLEHRLRLPQN
jgi:hypothetical protein